MEVWQLLGEIQQDLRYGFRIFRKAPAFTFIIVLTLALAVGANTAVFSVIEAVLLRPLPYKDPSQLVAVWDQSIRRPSAARLFDTYGDYQAYQANSRSFAQLAGVGWPTDVRMSGRGPAREVSAVLATTDFFRMLGAKAAVGRTFVREDMKQDCAVVLSNRFWKSALSGEKRIIGRNVRLDDRSCDVLGVMPPEFAFIPIETDLWTLVTSNSVLIREPNQNVTGIYGRLRPGVSAAAAASELRMLHNRAHMADRHGRNNAPQVFPLQEEFTSLSGRNLRLSLLVLFAAVAAVLLIACVNVANLLLGRALQRQREVSIRAALGSGRARLVQQLLTESLLLSVLAAVSGGLLAVAAVHYFQTLEPVTLPPGKPVEVNRTVLAFTAGLSVLTTLIFGLLPAWNGSKPDVNTVLKSMGRSATGSRNRRRLGQGLVIFEVMVSVVLLVGAGLLIRSVVEFSSAPLGFTTEGVVTMSLILSPVSYAVPAQRMGFYRRVMDCLAEIPDVRAWALTTGIPSLSGGDTGVLSVEGEPEAEGAPSDTGEQAVSREYFRFLRIPVLRGREFAATDSPGSEAVAVVNEALVRRYFPHENPLGKHLRFRGFGNTDWLLIVGVAANEKHVSHAQEMSWISSPLIYRPLTQDPPAQLHILVRGADGPGRLGDLVQRQLAALDLTVLVSDVETLEHLVLRFVAYPKFRAIVLGGFAGLALLFSVVGLYGVLSQLVEQRTQEIGVRMALGAQQRDVLALILRSGMLLTGAGVGLGLLASGALTRLLGNLLYGVGSTDPATFAGVALLLAAVAFFAMYLPARRAARFAPSKALRYE